MKTNEKQIITTNELENKLDELYCEMMKDYCYYVMNCRGRELSITAVLSQKDDDTYEIIDYEYNDLGQNESYIHNDDYIRINVYFVGYNGSGYDEWYDDAIKIWCDDHNIKYYDEETEEFYSDYNRDEVNEIFEEMFTEYVELDNRFQENFDYYINE